MRFLGAWRLTGWRSGFACAYVWFPSSAAPGAFLCEVVLALLVGAGCSLRSGVSPYQASSGRVFCSARSLRSAAPVRSLAVGRSGRVLSFLCLLVASARSVGWSTQVARGLPLFPCRPSVFQLAGVCSSWLRRLSRGRNCPSWSSSQRYRRAVSTWQLPARFKNAIKGGLVLSQLLVVGGEGGSNILLRCL
jgi:hypothetical protein